MRDTVMYLAAIVIGNISFSFMLVGVESVRHNNTLFYGQERADGAETPGAGLRSTALARPDFPPNELRHDEARTLMSRNRSRQDRRETIVAPGFWFQWVGRSYCPAMTRHDRHV